MSEINSKDKLDWFEFETITRRMVQSLLEPVLNKITDNKEAILLLTKSNKINIDKITELEFTLHKTNQRSTAFDDVYKKIAIVEKDRKQEQKQITHDIENFK